MIGHGSMFAAIEEGARRRERRLQCVVRGDRARWSREVKSGVTDDEMTFDWDCKSRFDERVLWPAFWWPRTPAGGLEEHTVALVDGALDASPAPCELDAISCELSSSVTSTSPSILRLRTLANSLVWMERTDGVSTRGRFSRGGERRTCLR